MADSVAGLLVECSGFPGDGLEAEVVIMVFGADLAHVIVDVAYGEIGSEGSCAH